MGEVASGAGRPLVDLVLPVHDATRPLRRAVESAVAGVEPALLRVTVVCHGLPRSAIEHQLTAVNPAMLRIVEFSDGIKSPAGPFNHGLSLASAPYVSIMGSDDYLEPGAMSAWIAHVRRRPVDAALVRLRHQSGEILHNPLARRGRSENVNVVKDRLFYRTAPLGLLRRTTVAALGLSFTERVPVGKDMNFSAQLWSSGGTFDYLRELPCYVIGSDAEGRITTMRRPVSQAMAAVVDLAGRRWVAASGSRVRRSLAIKLIRIHVLGAIAARPRAEDWHGSDVADLRSALERLLAVSPRALAPFSLADRALLAALRNPDAGPEHIYRAAELSRRARRMRLLMTRNPLRVVDRESSLVRYLLYRVSS